MPAQVHTGARVAPGVKAAVIALSQIGNPPLKPTQIAREVGIGQHTAQAILEREKNGDLIVDPAKVAAIKKTIASKFYSKLDNCLNGITPDKLEAMTAYQLTGMSGILHTNARLADGETTANVGIAAVVAKATRMDEESSIDITDDMFGDTSK